MIMNIQHSFKYLYKRTIINKIDGLRKELYECVDPHGVPTPDNMDEMLFILLDKNVGWSINEGLSNDIPRT